MAIKLQTFKARYFDKKNKLVEEEFILAVNYNQALNIAEEIKENNNKIDSFLISRVY